MTKASESAYAQLCGGSLPFEILHSLFDILRFHWMAVCRPSSILPPVLYRRLRLTRRPFTRRGLVCLGLVLAQPQA